MSPYLALMFFHIETRKSQTPAAAEKPALVSGSAFNDPKSKPDRRTGVLPSVGVQIHACKFPVFIIIVVVVVTAVLEIVAVGNVLE